MRAVVFACLLLASPAAAQRPFATGQGTVRERARETTVHVLIDGDVLAVSVEAGPCDRSGTCTVTRRWLLEGRLTQGPPRLRGGLVRAQSVPAGSSEIVPFEDSQAQLVCDVSLAPGTTELVGHCRLVGRLPADWAAARSFELTRTQP